MVLRRYCVTVLNGGRIPNRKFWTFDGARSYYLEHRNGANIFKWNGDYWEWLFGARELPRVQTTVMTGKKS